MFTDNERKIIENYCVANSDTLKDLEMSVNLSRNLGKPVGINLVRSTRKKLGIVKAKGRGTCRVLPKKE